MTARARSTVSKSDLAKLAGFCKSLGVTPAEVEIRPGGIVAVRFGEQEGLTPPILNRELERREIEAERVGQYGKRHKNARPQKAWDPYLLDSSR